MKILARAVPERRVRFELIRLLRWIVAKRLLSITDGRRKPEKDLIRNLTFGFGLDIGCGARPLADVGIDVNSNSRAQVVADMTHLPLRQKTFRWAVFNHSLEHVKDDVASLLEAKRIAVDFVIVAIPLYGISYVDHSHRHNWKRDEFQRLVSGLFSVERVVSINQSYIFLLKP